MLLLGQWLVPLFTLAVAIFSFVLYGASRDQSLCSQNLRKQFVILGIAEVLLALTAFIYYRSVMLNALGYTPTGCLTFAEPGSRSSPLIDDMVTDGSCCFFGIIFAANLIATIVGETYSRPSARTRFPAFIRHHFAAIVWVSSATGCPGSSPLYFWFAVGQASSIGAMLIMILLTWCMCGGGYESCQSFSQGGSY
jgi:hypothetical protein